MRINLTNLIVYLLAILLALWVIYLAYKIAQHVGAWPFA